MMHTTRSAVYYASATVDRVETYLFITEQEWVLSVNGCCTYTNRKPHFGRHAWVEWDYIYKLYMQLWHSRHYNER